MIASPGWAWMLGGFVLGALIGSFLATIVLRWPLGQSVVAGRSRCDGCGRALRVIEIVPLASAIVQRGRCRGCGARIPVDHAIVEWSAALIGALALGVAPGWSGLAWAIFGWLLLALAALDIRHFWLPDRLTLPLAGFGLAIGGTASGAALRDRIIGAAAGFGALWLIASGYRWLRGRDGLGLGDAKLLGAIGAWLGWAALPLVLLSASLTGLIAAAVSGGLRGDRMVPFGAALAAGAVPGWLLLGWLT